MEVMADNELREAAGLSDFITNDLVKFVILNIMISDHHHTFAQIFNSD